MPLPAIAVASPLFALVALFYSMVCLFVVYASAARACDTTIGSEAEVLSPASHNSLSPIDPCRKGTSTSSSVFTSLPTALE
jgi:hypothetical protein